MRDRLCEERAADERAADAADPVGAQPRSQRSDQRSARGGVHQKRVECDPEVRVIPRLEKEVAARRGRVLENAHA